MVILSIISDQDIAERRLEAVLLWKVEAYNMERNIEYHCFIESCIWASWKSLMDNFSHIDFGTFKTWIDCNSTDGEILTFMLMNFRSESSDINYHPLYSFFRIPCLYIQ